MSGAARGRRRASDAALRTGAHAARALLREFGGWGKALGAARAEGLRPLIAAATRAGLLSPPGPFKASLEASERLSVVLAAAAAEAAADASRALASAGVPHAVMKGAAVARLYGDRSLRPLGDVDLLVGRADGARATEALLLLGYRVGRVNPVETALEPQATLLAVALDLHHALAHPGQFAPDAKGMLARARESEGVRVLAAEDELLVGALHMARDCFVAAGRSAADVAVISRAAAPDWGVVAGRARAWGLTAAAWAALECARRAMGAFVPREATRALRPTGAREAYLRAWLDLNHVSPCRLAGRAGEWAPKRFAMAALWPAFVDGAARRARFLARYALDRLRLVPARKP